MNWREFEILVARIESLLVPTGAVVKSPDKVPDLTTGSEREVDASIRYQIGSVDILITVECRKRSPSQDVTWIEQLATKKNDIGASETIAIASSGLSKNARKKARLKGIKIRTLKEITDHDILSWATSLEIRRTHYDYLRARATFHYYDREDIPIDLLEPFLGEFKRSGVDACVFFDHENGNITSISGILEEHARKENPDRYKSMPTRCQITLGPSASMAFGSHPGLELIFDGVPLDGPIVKKRLKLEFEPNQLSVDCKAGKLFLREMDLIFLLQIRTEKVPITRALTYGDPNGPIAEIVEYETSIGSIKKPETSILLTQHRLKKVPDKKS